MYFHVIGLWIITQIPRMIFDKNVSVKDEKIQTTPKFWLAIHFIFDELTAVV